MTAPRLPADRRALVVATLRQAVADAVLEQLADDLLLAALYALIGRAHDLARHVNSLSARHRAS